MPPGFPVLETGSDPRQASPGPTRDLLKPPESVSVSTINKRTKGKTLVRHENGAQRKRVAGCWPPRHHKTRTAADDTPRRGRGHTGTGPAHAGHRSAAELSSLLIHYFQKVLPCANYSKADVAPFDPSYKAGLSRAT